MRVFTGYDPRNGRCAINECALALADEVQRAPTDLQFASQTSAPVSIPYVNIRIPPVIGADGVTMGPMRARAWRVRR